MEKLSRDINQREDCVDKRNSLNSFGENKYKPKIETILVLKRIDLIRISRYIQLLSNTWDIFFAQFVDDMFIFGLRLMKSIIN